MIDSILKLASVPLDVQLSRHPIYIYIQFVIHIIYVYIYMFIGYPWNFDPWIVPWFEGKHDAKLQWA